MDPKTDLQRCTNPDRNNGPSVKLIVGPTEEIFEIQEDLICSKCSFFYNAFSGNFLESQTKVLRLIDDDPTRIADLCAWLKYGSMRAVNKGSSWLWLAQTWLFADKYHIDDFQNRLIDALYAKFAAHEEGINISFETLDYVVENTTLNSPLRRIFADMLVNGISLRDLPKRIESIPVEFVQDMCIALKTTMYKSGPVDTFLLSNPVSAYYSSSALCKATAIPKANEQSTLIYCECDKKYDNCDYCKTKESGHVTGNMMYYCSKDKVMLCYECGLKHPDWCKTKMSLRSNVYRTASTGPGSEIVDVQAYDSSFYCNGPRCNPHGLEVENLQRWQLISGDQYRCLKCEDVDYCTLCIRGPLKCKDDGHRMMRSRKTCAQPVPLTGEVSVKLRQQRLAEGLCCRCGTDKHETRVCEAEEAVLSGDIEVED